MRILGIDPGLGRVGFGLLEIVNGAYGPCQWGLITTSKDKPDGARLQEIQRDLDMVLNELQPDVIALERIFFFKNAKTLVPVTQARGVILLGIHNRGIPVYEYTPMQVKQALTGYGKSTKAEIQDMLVTMLNLARKPTPDDAADALAMAVCHFHHQGRYELPPVSAG